MGLSTNFCSVLFCWIQIPAMMLVFFPSFVVVKSPKKCTLELQKKTRFILAKINQWWIVDTLKISKPLFLQSHLHCDSYVFIWWFSIMTWHTQPSYWSSFHVLPPGPIWWVDWWFCSAEATKNLQSMLRPIMTPMQPQRRGVLKTLQFWKGGIEKRFLWKGLKYFEKIRNFGSW